MTWIADWKCEKFNAEIDADLEEFGTLDFIPVCEERKNQFRLYDNPMLSELRWGDLIQGERNGNTIFLKKIIQRAEHSIYDYQLLSLIEDKDTFLKNIMEEGGFWAHEQWFMDSWYIWVPPAFPLENFVDRELLIKLPKTLDTSIPDLDKLAEHAFSIEDVTTKDIGFFHAGSILIESEVKGSGYPSYGSAEVTGSSRQQSGGKKQFKNIENYANDLVIIDYLIEQKLNGIERPQFPETTDPKLEKIIRKRYENPYDWMEAHHLFKNRYRMHFMLWQENQEGATEPKSKIIEETKLKKTINQLQKSRTKLCDEIEKIDEQILLLKTNLEK